MDDQRIGSGLRAMRIRRRLRQRDLSSAAGVPRGVIALIEHGRLDDVGFGQIRAVARALDARFEGLVRWQGGDLDRLTNRAHAQMHEAMARWFAELDGWLAVPEVSFAHYAERGVIDVMAWHASTGIVLVIELKTAIVDINDLMSTMDRRRRLAWKIANDLGWNPKVVATWVVALPACRTVEPWPSTRLSSAQSSLATVDRCVAGSLDPAARSPPSVSCQKPG